MAASLPLTRRFSASTARSPPLSDKGGFPNLQTGQRLTADAGALNEAIGLARALRSQRASFRSTPRGELESGRP